MNLTRCREIILVKPWNPTDNDNNSNGYSEIVGNKLMHCDHDNFKIKACNHQRDGALSQKRSADNTRRYPYNYGRNTNLKMYVILNSSWSANSYGSH
jgi:hypothetical protein